MTASDDNDHNDTWYRDWFDADYLRVYAHRDHGDAVAGVELLARTLDGPPPGPCLDLACGAGRHLQELRSRNFPAVGLDLSSTLLAQARGSAAGPLIRADMRSLPFRPGELHLITSFFTSFGYFSDAQNRAVIAEIAAALAPGGALFFDYLNRTRVLAALDPSSERRTGEMRITEQRHWDPVAQRLTKDITLDDQGRIRHARESVRLYAPLEIDALLAAAGLTVVDTFGDAHGAAFDPEQSPRYILLARKG